MEPHRFAKKWWPAALAAGLFVAAAFIYLLSPDAMGAMLRSGGAAVVGAWRSAVGGADDGLSAPEVDLSGVDEASGTLTGLDDGPILGGDPVSDGASDRTKDVPAAAKSAAATASGAIAAADDAVVVTDGLEVAADGAAAGAGGAGAGAATEDRASAAPPACSISTSTGISRKILLNEIAWMGSPPGDGETASHAGEREWFELRNNSGDKIDLKDWQIIDRSGNIKIVLSADVTVASGGYALFLRGKNYSGGLSNAGDVLAVFDPACAESDVLDASAGWPAGNNATKQTLERDADGLGWHTSVPEGGTPGAENSDPAPEIADHVMSVIVPVPEISAPPSETARTEATSSDSGGAAEVATTTATSTVEATTTDATSTQAGVGHLVIAAVAIAGASSSNDFVRVLNPTARAVAVAGWRLRKRSSTGNESSLRELPEGSVIAPGAYFTWANSAGGFGDAIGADVTSTETLAADNSVALLDASGTVIDAVAWGAGDGQYVEGSPYPADPEAGQTLARVFADGVPVDTDDNASDFVIQ